MLEAKQIEKYSDSDYRIRKECDSVILLNDKYKTPNTSLLLFHFEPFSFSSSEYRLKNCSLMHKEIEGKDIYLYDNFFSDIEGEEMCKYSREASFSRSSYASNESQEKGEEPARSMNNKEKWEFFAKPPQPIKEIYKFLETVGDKLNADISTLPWDLCDQKICASAVATNRLEKVSQESMDMGKHEDFNTQEGIPFGIPILYSKDNNHFSGSFKNGAIGNPWLISFMLYATENNFKSPEWGVGTIFCNNDGKTEVTADCKHMRFVIFEGDIVHSIEKSNIPPEFKTWRVSYVFKLMMNPKEQGKSLKKEFNNLMKTSTGGHHVK